MSRPVLAVGDTITVPEADYCYGLGELYMRITALPSGTRTPGVEWAEIMGRDILADGSESPERYVSVRLAAVRVPAAAGAA